MGSGWILIKYSNHRPEFVPSGLIESAMEQTDIKEIIKESLDLLKEKIVVAFADNDDTAVDKEVGDVTDAIAKMISGLEELAFEAGRLQEDDGSFVFDDFDDFQNS